MKTETQLLSDIFQKDRLEHATLGWICAPVLMMDTPPRVNAWHGTPEQEADYAALYAKAEAEAYFAHDHQDHTDGECEYSSGFTWERLPQTEADFARSLASFIGTDTLVYVPALDEWQIMDDGVYRGLPGELFVHNCIKRYTSRYEKIVKGVPDLNGMFGRPGYLEGIRTMAEREFNYLIPTGDKDQDVKQKEKYWVDYATKAGHVFSMLRRLKSEGGIRAVTNLMKSDLYERPPSVDDLGFTGLADFMDEAIEPGLVEGLITARGMGQIFGPAYRGKTYTAVDLACSVAAGLSTWMGRPINVDGPQQVLYIAAEGGDPIRKMFQGWQAAHPDADLSGVTIRDGAKGASLTLSDKTLPPGVYGLEDLKNDYRNKGTHPRLIVIDPQANVTSAVEENSTALAHALQPLQGWANEEYMFVMLVHHSGKDEDKGARGSSAQGALMDVQIQFKGKEGSKRSMHFLKVKGEVAPDYPVEIEFVKIETSKGERSYIRHVGKLPTPLDKANGDGLLLRSKVIAAIEAGRTSGSAIATHTGVDRNRISPVLQALGAEGRIINLGVPSHPKWTMAPKEVPTDSIPVSASV